ncbi:MAG: hypothetical protein LBU79_00050 [Planctomycetota bacterium]|jgi:hypothetical protein|nr:hypothetical protein [Planctomycetota bacterium]
MFKNTPVFIAAPLLCWLMTGCFSLPIGGKKEVADKGNKPALEKTYRLSEASGGKTGEEIDLDQPSSPAASIQRDLAKLRLQEEKQARLLSELQENLSAESLRLQKETGYLGSLRQHIQSYEEALAGLPDTSQFREGTRLARYPEGKGGNLELAAVDNPHPPLAPTNIALDKARPYYEGERIAVGPEEVATRQTPWDKNNFAGAPRGVVRQNLTASPKQALAPGEKLVWSPPDPLPDNLPFSPVNPGLDVTPEMSLGKIPDRRDYPEKPPQPIARPAAVQEDTFALGGSTFSPDLYLGNGG